MLPGDLVARVEAWVADGPRPRNDGPSCWALWQSGDEGGLRDRFDHPLSFGTAGLRGELGAGPGRMNRLVVRKTTAGLAQYLLDLSGHQRQARSRASWSGHDARHGSAEFADDAARVAAASGVRARRFETALPTPVTAFAVRHLRGFGRRHGHRQPQPRS